MQSKNGEDEDQCKNCKMAVKLTKGAEPIGYVEQGTISWKKSI